MTHFSPDHGHAASDSCSHCEAETKRSRSRAWVEAGAMLILVIALYKIVGVFNLFSLSPKAEGVLGLGTVFIIGLAASLSSCLAVVGGLLLSVSAKWCEVHQRDSHWFRLKPLLLFNVGRLIGYFLLGGLIALIGQKVVPSLSVTGYVTIAVAVVMIILGLNILHIVPKKYCTIPLPSAMRRHIQNLSNSANPLLAILLGGLTFFLPCGFTQSMQFLAFESGNFFSGAMIMLVFALGTLPALLGISLVSSFSEGRGARWFIKFSGALVLLLGIVNLNSGLLITGVDASRALSFMSAGANTGSDPYVTIDKNGQQVITVYVSSHGYAPNSFTIQPGIRTWVYAVAPDDVSGCASFLTAPTYGLSVAVKKGETWLGPIENPTSDFYLACSMGMYKADIHIKKS